MEKAYYSWEAYNDPEFRGIAQSVLIDIHSKLDAQLIKAEEEIDSIQRDLPEGLAPGLAPKLGYESLKKNPHYGAKLERLARLMHQWIFLEQMLSTCYFNLVDKMGLNKKENSPEEKVD